MGLAKSRRLRYLDLDDNQVGAAGMVYLADALKTNTSLTEIYLHGNHIGSTGMNHLSDALSQNKGLKCIGVTNNHICDSCAVSVLRELRPNTCLSSLNLSGNCIGDEAAASLAELLKKNNALKRLILSNNEVTNKGARMLAESLVLQNSLKHVSIIDNVCDDEWVDIIQDLVHVDTSEAVKSTELLQVKTLRFYAGEMIRNKNNEIKDVDEKYKALYNSELVPKSSLKNLAKSIIELKDKRILAQGNEIEKLKREVKRRDEELGELRNKTSDMSKDMRGMESRMMESETCLKLALQESKRLQTSLAEERRRNTKLKQDMAELAEENNSNKARLLKFEEASAETESRNSEIKTIAGRCLSQLQMASNEMGVLSRSITLKDEAEPDTKRQRTEFGETVLAIQLTLGKLEEISNAVNLKPENHRCPVCYDSYGGKVIPAMLQCCLNQVCVDCVEKDRAQKISLLVGNKKRIQCMLCNHPFHCEKDSLWRINRPYIEAIGIRVNLNDFHQEISSPKLDYQGIASAQGQDVGATGRGNNFMVAALQVDDWLIFKSSGDEHQRFWLGRAVAKLDWGGSCKARNESNASVSIEGAFILPGCFAINVQWYTQRVIGLLEYVKEGQPLVQSNEDLKLGGFNRHVNHRLDDRGDYFELDSAISDRAESLIM